MTRLPVVKTYKLYVGGAFARSESGRHLSIEDHAGNRVANAPRATRKDVRDAVRAARGALPGWQGRSAYNRGQILYRFAEALESRADELTGETARLRGIERGAARAEIEAAVDHAVHYAGWTDKLHAVLGAVNPVAAPHFNFTMPEPTGVVRDGQVAAGLAAHERAAHVQLVGLGDGEPVGGRHGRQATPSRAGRCQTCHANRR